MKILSIETSCDETAVSVVEAKGGLSEPYFSVLGNALFSQIATHAKYGGVFPMMAKREHAKNLPRLLVKALTEAKLFVEKKENVDEKKWKEIKKILEREDNLCEDLKKVLKNIRKPKIDVIAITAGPGLEPALWVGISFAKALSTLWNIPVIPVNHMEGHITSVLMNKTEKFLISDFQFSKKNVNAKKPDAIKFPAVALLISGGHTELVEIKNWGKYKIMGQTRDDAVGEAFDKVARMLGLPYPGGPEISRLAEKARAENLPRKAKLPRPMIHSDDFDFSFSGLKTAALYYLRDHGDLNDLDKADIAREFEDSVVEILTEKTKKALEESGAQTLIIGGGVISNKKLQESFKQMEKENIGVQIKMPEKNMATDNALMIASACYINILINPKMVSEKKEIKAQGNLKLS